MRRRTVWSLIILSMVLIPLLASELSVNSYVDQTRIGLDDVLRFTIEISGVDAGKVGQPELPEISGFTNIGTSTSSSSSVSIVNGRMTSTVSRSYIYSLRPQTTGQFLIPPISIQTDQQTLATNPIRITVVEGTTQPPPLSRQFRDQAVEPEQIADNIFILAEPSKTTVMRGEPLVVHYNLYSRYDLANLTYVNEPNFIGFWKDDIFFANRMNFQRTNYRGSLFNVMRLRTLVLYPNQSGTLIIPSLEIDTDIIVRPRTFFDFDSTRKLRVASKPVSISVRELPLEGRPDSFTGAVGNFQIRSEIREQEFNVGDTFTYTLRITGNGNFKHFDPPPFPQTTYLRHIDPEVTTDSKLEGERVAGSKTIRYPVILTEEGNFNIPALTFAFYNPERNSYQTLQTSSYPISVNPSEMRTIPLTVAQQDVIAEGADIYYIYSAVNLDQNGYLNRSLFYWLTWLLFSLTIPLAFVYRKERAKLASDVNYVRQKQARKILHKYMHKATKAAKDGNLDFYTFVNTGLANYLTDNLKIPRGSTTETIIIELQRQLYSPEMIDKIRKIINRCLEARFMPGGFIKDKIAEDYRELQDTVALISRQKKNSKKQNEIVEKGK
ncbi:MAG: BatD family protein [Candidatus Cloacimonetes bacterium]|nr:BatD family protein [Candidatus Cloacimonadota bacterium]